MVSSVLGDEQVEVPPHLSIFAGSWFNSAAILSVSFNFSPLERVFCALLCPATCSSAPDPSQAVPNLIQSPSAAPGGVPRGLPIPATILEEVSGFICSSEEARSEGWLPCGFPFAFPRR